MGFESVYIKIPQLASVNGTSLVKGSWELPWNRLGEGTTPKLESGDRAGERLALLEGALSSSEFRPAMMHLQTGRLG